MSVCIVCVLMVFVPVNLNRSHWIVVEVRLFGRVEIRYWDSYNGYSQMVVATILRWLRDEHFDKLMQPFPLNREPALQGAAAGAFALQTDRFNCGLFVLTKMAFLFFGLPHHYVEQRLMAILRLVVTAELATRLHTSTGYPPRLAMFATFCRSVAKSDASVTRSGGGDHGGGSGA